MKRKVMKMGRLKKGIVVLAAGFMLCQTTITASATEMPNADAGWVEPPLTYHSIEKEADVTSVLDDPTYAGPLYTDMESKYDPLENGGLPTVRDQSPYGTCWAFSALGMGETSRYINNNEEIDLSELHLAYFVYNSVIDPLGGLEGDSNASVGGSFMERGGNLDFAYKVLSSWTGAADEATAPYENASIAMTNGLASSIAYEDKLHLQGAYMINLNEDAQIAKQMIKEYGGIGSSYYSESYPYNEYYNSTYNSYYCPETAAVNHAIMIVGWDDGFSKENFNTQPEGDGAWLIRNSWGGSGYDYYSYFWMSYYDQSLSSVAYAFEYEDADNYDNNYQYDGSMLDSSFSSSGTLKVANVFTAKANPDGKEVLRAVAFDTYAYVNMDYEINIYTNLTDLANPESGTLVNGATTCGKTSLGGYYTVDLEKPVDLFEGDTFAVVIKLSKSDGSRAGIAAECPMTASWYKTTTSALEGQSFRYNGSQWTDFGSQYNRNIRIKAFTDSYDWNRPVTSITLDIASKTINKGETFTLIPNVQPQNTDASLKWESSNIAVATVDSNGKVTGIGEGSAKITVKSGDISASCTVTVKTSVTSISLSKTTAEMYVGNTLTLTAKLIPENAIDTVTWTSSNSNVATVDQNGKVTAKAAGSAVITAKAGNVHAQCTINVKAVPQGKFIDVSESDWFYNSVYYAYENGIMSGTGNNMFSPQVSTNRAMVVQILYNVSGKPQMSGITQFDDVSSGAWYAKAVQWAAETGVTAGISPKCFAPEREVTRQEVAAFLFRYAKDQGYDVSGRNDLSSFADSNQVDSWALEAMQWANNAGIINGKGNSQLDPRGFATRAEIATMMKGFMMKYR